MKELWLNFKDENGKDQRVLVEGEKFAIGRTPDNDLQIPLGSLSRQHAKIERFADVFVISDCGSSNGSSLNDEKLEKPVGLKNGDKLNLGDAIEIEIEITSDEDEDANGGVSPAPSLDDDENAGAVSASSSAGLGGTSNAASASASSGGGSGSLWLLMIAPILMVLVLLGLGGAILIARSKKEPEIVKNDNTFITSKDDDEFSGDDGEKTPVKEETPTPASTATPIANSETTSNSGNTSSDNSTATQTVTPDPGVETTSTPKLSNEGEKIKFASANFLRRIANTDPHAFLLEKQIAVLSPKINQFKGSAVLAENIRNAKKNSAKIAEMATSKGLKPQLLAVAALTKLGNQRGDVVAVAGEMMEKISNIMQPFGNDFADDSLLIMAAYSGGKSGEQLQNTVGSLSNRVKNVTSRTIRSIWFFRENNELSNAEFDFALQFLAIGTITQNPKDFNVSAEALVF